VLAALAALPRSPVPGRRWSTPDQWHVTLRFFGELGPTEVENASVALAAVAGSWPAPFEVEGGPRTRFLGPGLVVWPVEGLTGVAQAVEQATAAIGQPVPERRFLGHVTVSRIRRGTGLHEDPRLLQPLSASWTVTSLSLVASELHPDGARYRDVQTFPLARHSIDPVG
jgi:RNA 2',3'-cyclic 3'-phosphodiesterase